MTEENNNLDELKKNIVIERLRQAPQNIKISFGMSNGEFMERDALIENIKNNTQIGKNIVNVQMEYLKIFKTGFVSGAN